MPVISINSTEIFYQYEDFGNKEIILFSNSLGTDHKMWEPQIDILSHHFNILRYDTRGHGQSGVQEGDYTIEQLGNDVLGLLDTLKIDQVIFCGISMGGLVGQWLGIHAPERLSNLIISNSAAKIGSAEGWNSRIADVRKNGLESIISATAERWFTTAFIKNNDSQVQAVLNVFKNTSINGYTACCAAVRDADFREQLFEIEVPVLVISGLQDKVTTVEDGKYLAKRIPVARHVAVNTAHLANMAAAEEFCKLILFQTQH